MSAKPRKQPRSRTLETRDAVSRDSMAQFMDHLESPHSLHIGKENVPHGVRYFLARKNYREFEDKMRIPELKRKHWRFVPRDRHPELFVGNEKDVTNENIEIDGLVLMERDDVWNKAEEQFYRKKNWEQLNVMPGLENFKGTRAIPANLINETGRTIEKENSHTAGHRMMDDDVDFGW